MTHHAFYLPQHSDSALVNRKKLALTEDFQDQKAFFLGRAPPMGNSSAKPTATPGQEDDPPRAPRLRMPATADQLVGSWGLPEPPGEADPVRRGGKDILYVFATRFKDLFPFFLPCDKGDTVVKLKERIQDMHGIPVQYQKLVWKQRTLADEWTREEYVAHILQHHGESPALPRPPKPPCLLTLPRSTAALATRFGGPS